MRLRILASKRTPIFLGALLAAGCVAVPASPPGRRVPRDACQDRLHEACGLLLQYYAVKSELPRSLDDLAKMPGGDPSFSFTCPVSGKPYAFNSDGLFSPGKPGRILIYDADPVHSGLRWAVLVAPPSGKEPLVARVIALGEEPASRTKGP